MLGWKPRRRPAPPDALANPLANSLDDIAAEAAKFGVPLVKQKPEGPAPLDADALREKNRQRMLDIARRNGARESPT